jgi:hypothetical protein
MQFSGDFIKVSRNRWDFQPTPLRPDRILEIDWAKLIPDKVGTKHQREYLIKSCGQFLSAWILSSRTGQLSGGSVVGIYSKIKRLVNWMVVRNVWRFGELSKIDISDFFRITEEEEHGLRKHSQV